LSGETGSTPDTCAVTGLKLINGGGRSEVQAAHIRPVADRGPDSVRNGLALSGTVHWMFDRGLISVDDDYNLLIASGGVPDTITRLINPERRLLVPERTGGHIRSFCNITVRRCSRRDEAEIISAREADPHSSPKKSSSSRLNSTVR